MRRRGRTPPFRGPSGEVVPGSIAEIECRRLGALDQWVLIRGESVANPPLILLHGGPGLSETALIRHFNAALEKVFTVSYWDQRGAGKSFDRSIPRSSMTVEQFISDLDELVDAVRKRLDKAKVMIFGHSWGAVLGPLYAARFPDKVAAYAGSGQIGDWAASESRLLPTKSNRGRPDLCSDPHRLRVREEIGTSLVPRGWEPDMRLGEPTQRTR